MRDILAVAAIVLSGAGCAAAIPDQAEDRILTLATFTGEIDHDAGTMTVRTSPASYGTAGAGAHLVIDEGASTVTIATVAGTVSRVTDGCSAGTDALQGSVRVTLTYPSPTYLGAVYAELLSVTPTGAASCNSVAAPTGLTAANGGLWSYGTVSQAAKTSTQAWRFAWTSGVRSTFTGRIVAVKGDAFTTSLPTPSSYAQIIAYDGSGKMVYGSSGTSLVFMNLDGTWSSTGTAALPASATSIKVDPANDRIWFTTTNDGSSKGWAGYAALDGSSQTSAKPTESNSPGLQGIALDPDDANKAWFYGSQSATTTIYSITVGTPPTFSSFSGGSYDGNGMAIGPDKNIYVTHYGANLVQKYARTGGAALGSYTTPVGCRGPNGIIHNTADGTLWFTAGTDNAVCSMTTAGVFTAKASLTAAPRNFLTLDSTGVVWTGAYGGTGAGLIFRAITGDPAFTVTATMNNWALGALASSPAVTVGGTSHPAYVWATGNNVNRLQP